MEDEQWVIEVNEEVKRLPDTSEESEYWSKRSIYKIPSSVTDINKSAYKPQVVSLGPYHHGLEDVKAMEKHKRRALLHFLNRSKKPLQSFVHALTPVVEDLRDAYDQLDPKWKENNKFLEMMIVDGCFVLEILRSNMATEADHAPRKKDYASNDPIFSNHGKLYIVLHLKHDMLMLENQLPMLLLKKLGSIQIDKSFKDGKELTRHILRFFYSQDLEEKDLHQFDKCLHILDIYRRSLLLGEPRPEKHKTKSRDHHHLHFWDGIIRTATELNEAGIRIEKSYSRSLKDISFHDGVLKLPPVVVDDAFESMYLNLIALERFHVGAGTEVTSFIFFMDSIIDSARDVSLLHSCDTIQNMLGSDKAVANLFSSLSKDITLDPESSIEEVNQQISAYCRKAWATLRHWKANLKHNYFSNPWSFLSLNAAIFLFALTTVQTIYTVLSYVTPPN